MSNGGIAEVIDALARTNNSTPVREILTALDRVDGVPGVAAADLSALLAGADDGQLADRRADLQRLATQGKSDNVRQAGFAALLRADAVAERCGPRPKARRTT